jgi:hypothetical protein
MTGGFHLESGGLSPLSDIHTEVANGISGLTAGTPEAGELAQAFGTIGSNLGNYLGGALESRGGAFKTTQELGHDLAGKLKKAHQMYLGGDEQSAQDIRSAAKAFDDSKDAQPGSGAPNSATPGGGGASGGSLGQGSGAPSGPTSAGAAGASPGGTSGGASSGGAGGAD